MRKFHEVIDSYRFWSQFGRNNYRIVWIVKLQTWLLMEIFDSELDRIDQSKIEIVIK